MLPCHVLPAAELEYLADKRVATQWQCGMARCKYFQIRRNVVKLRGPGCRIRSQWRCSSWRRSPDRRQYASRIGSTGIWLASKSGDLLSDYVACVQVGRSVAIDCPCFGQAWGLARGLEVQVHSGSGGSSSLHAIIACHCMVTHHMQLHVLTLHYIHLIT